MRATANQTKILVVATIFLVIAGCANNNETIKSLKNYNGNIESFTKFKDDHDKKDWPEPEKMAYYDPEGTGAEVIRYAHWAPPQGNSEGVVVHFNGRTEFIEKNIYTYKDLLERGYEVWALDWRGQGFSQRQIEEKQKHSIDSFDTYVEDAAHFIDNLTNTKATNGKKVLLAHSMGGQIALRYLLDYPDTFDYAVLSSPLLRLPGNKILKPFIRAGNWVKRNTFFSNSCVFLDSPTWSTSFADGDPCEHVDKGPDTQKALKKVEDTKEYSHAYEKVADIECLIASSIDANEPENPDLRVACPTSGWVYEAFRSIDKVMEEAKSLETPVLIVRTKYDTKVDPDAQDEFCKQTDKCRLETIPENGEPETGHELLVETDEIRKKFFEYFDEFVK